MRNWILALCVLGAIASPALADDKVKAKALYDEGLRHYNLAEYSEAIASWKQAYMLSKKPLLLFNIGQAYRLSGDCTQAMVFYDNYQREEPSPKNQDELEQSLALCKDKPAKPPDKPVVTDTKPVVTDTKPVVTETKPIVTPRPPTDTKPKDTKVADRGNDLAERQPPPPIDHPSGGMGGMAKAGIVIGATGVVLEVAAIVFALDSQKQSNTLNDYHGDWGMAQQAIENKGKHDTKLAYTFGGIGAAALIAGGVLFVMGRNSGAEHAPVSVAPTPGGATVAYTFDF
jgi:tetratricopeptide (TPR) repeat protein